MNAFVPVTPDQITIAVTVFSRRQYIHRAVSSALAQTQPVRVMVVEDCGPDPTLQDYVQAGFGDRIEYIRNPKRRGLFDNWNACLDYCRTPWLSILHDDDYLAPNCVESIIRLARQQPGCALYCGHFKVVDDQGNHRPELGARPVTAESERIALRDVYQATPIAFAGTLFSVNAVRALGGFNPHSQFAGDWEMWSKLIAHYGAAATRDHVSYVLSHYGADRGSAVIDRSGRAHALNYVQRKRIVALLKQQGKPMSIDRRRDQASTPVSVGALLRFGADMSPRLLDYNLKLLAFSRSPNWQHAAGSVLLRALGEKGVRALSRVCNKLGLGKQHR